MKVSDYKRLSYFSQIDTNFVQEVVDIPFVRVSSDLSSILSEIFSVDPVSGLPKGDIAYYLSDDGNPEIKNWLQNNLLAPRAVMSGSSLEGVTDDLIAECARRADESVSSYAERMSNIRDTALADIEKFKQELKTE